MGDWSRERKQRHAKRDRKGHGVQRAYGNQQPDRGGAPGDQRELVCGTVDGGGHNKASEEDALATLRG